MNFRKPFLKFVYGCLAVFIFGLVPCPVTGQVLSKKQLTEEDYALWGKLEPRALSDDSRWAAYAMRYDLTDTLFVINTHSKRLYSFPHVGSGKFGGDHLFAYLKDGNLNMTNLNSGIVESIAGVSEFEFRKENLIYLQEVDLRKRIVIKTKNYTEIIQDVTDFEVSPNEDALFYVQYIDSLYTPHVALLNKSVVIIPIDVGSPQSITKITWQHNGASVAFFREEFKESLPAEICHYSLEKSILRGFVPATSKGFPEGMEADAGNELSMMVSDDGTKVFFGVKSTIVLPVLDDPAVVQVWNANDALLYPIKNVVNGWHHQPKLAVWWPESGNFRQISSALQPWVMLSGDQEHAVLATPGQYGAAISFYGDMDYHLLNLETGEKKLFLERQYSADGFMGISPDGQYINYYRDHNWWVYDILRATHSNVTASLPQCWDNTDNDPNNDLYPHGNPCWSSDSRHLILYDAFDIWAISPDGTHRQRLTNGRERQIRFTLEQSSIERLRSNNYSGRAAATCDLSKSLVLDAYGYKDSSKGYFRWGEKAGLHSIAYGEESNSNLIKSKGGGFFYIQQTYSQSPRLFIIAGKSKRKLLYESNIHQRRYTWGSAKMLYYRNSKNEVLKASLYYPANYNSTKKYPMAVYIYEKVAHAFHSYVNPSVYNVVGFNISNLTSKGYFVLLPDINYEAGEPGGSAVDCVTHAVRYVVDQVSVDPRRIGLYGHSFGGYETNFIVTQTNIFAAAISGSGVSDVVSGYFTYGKNSGMADIWRYERQQFRLGKPFYGNQSLYYKNSPILYADNITTPLLSWSGDADPIIKYDQSMEFYLAMRRLKKKNIFLLYPKADHALDAPEQQADLTRRVEDWFDHFLKGENAKPWISSGLQGLQ